MASTSPAWRCSCRENNYHRVSPQRCASRSDSGWGIHTTMRLSKRDCWMCKTIDIKNCRYWCDSAGMHPAACFYSHDSRCCAVASIWHLHLGVVVPFWPGKKTVRCLDSRGSGVCEEEEIEKCEKNGGELKIRAWSIHTVSAFLQLARARVVFRLTNHLSRISRSRDQLLLLTIEATIELKYNLAK
jgi:hypothetical protein